MIVAMFILILCLILLIKLRGKNMDDMIIRNSQLQKVTNAVSYFTVENCVEKYREYLKDKDNTAIYNLLAYNYKQEEQITEQNVLNKVSPIAETAVIKSIYESEQDNEMSFYVVYFSENDMGVNGLILIQDEENQTFSIYPNEFIESNGYNQIDNIIEEDIKNRLQKIEVNDNNTYIYYYLSDKEILQKHMQNFIAVAENNIQDAYEMIEETCKQEKFQTLQEFEEYIDKNGENLTNIEIISYDTIYQNDYVEYVFSDSNNNEYRIKEKYIMEYTICI